jgi:putative hemolysin
MPKNMPEKVELGLPRAWGWWTKPINALVGLNQLQQVYDRIPAHADPQGFVRHACRELGLNYRVEHPQHLPESGGVVVVANHPFGGAEGLMIADWLLQHRPDVRLLGNVLLARMPQFAPLMFPINVFASGGINGESVRAAKQHLQAGGVLLVFPAGEVSRFDRHSRTVQDPHWRKTAVELAEQSGATLLPLWVGGHTRKRSLLAGLLHPLARTALLPRDLLALKQQHVVLSVGLPCQPQELAGDDAPARTQCLRLLCEAAGRVPAPVSTPASWPEVAAAQPVADLQANIAALPPESCLLQRGDWRVFLAKASQLPVLLPEIARLRELSFRAVGEGSGLAADTDRFDQHYQHLFLWHQGESSIVGAYRLGFSQDLAVPDFYTHTLFDYDQRLFEHTGAIMELGRSFVAPAWQRRFQPLRLLWAGIAEVINQRPDLRYLFGPVSISPRYSALAQALIQASLNQHHSDPHLQALVRPRSPSSQRQHSPPAVVAGLAAPEQLSRLLARLQGGATLGEGLPVLLRQYLELKGRFAGFNVDKDFNDTLDGLVFVEIAGIPERFRRRL